MPLNDNNSLPNLSCDQGITADYVNSLFGIPQTDNDDLDDSLFDSCSQYINTSNILYMTLHLITTSPTNFLA